MRNIHERKPQQISRLLFWSLMGFLAFLLSQVSVTELVSAQGKPEEKGRGSHRTLKSPPKPNTDQPTIATATALIRKGAGRYANQLLEPSNRTPIGRVSVSDTIVVLRYIQSTAKRGYYRVSCAGVMGYLPRERVEGITGRDKKAMGKMRERGRRQYMRDRQQAKELHQH